MVVQGRGIQICLLINKDGTVRRLNKFTHLFTPQLRSNQSRCGFNRVSRCFYLNTAGFGAFSRHVDTKRKARLVSIIVLHKSAYTRGWRRHEGCVRKKPARVLDKTRSNAGDICVPFTSQEFTQKSLARTERNSCRRGPVIRV